MAGDDCEKLHARAEMLHHESEHGRAKAGQRGPGWIGYAEQVWIAAHCEAMARVVETKIAHDC